MFSYDAYDRLTRTYVNERGLVDYEGVKRELGVLRTFVEQLAAVSPVTNPELFPNDDERKRYYLTAYNALVLYYAAEAYPNKYGLWSRFGYFKNKDIVLGGRELTLNDLEHQIIRKKFLDPRIHFYINCGAKSCPPMRAKAMAQNAADSELDDAARRFINDPANVRFDADSGKLSLSKIFDWFSDDFLRYLRAHMGHDRPHIAQYIALYLDGDAGRALARTPLDAVRLEYLKYDKDLNEG